MDELLCFNCQLWNDEADECEGGWNEDTCSNFPKGARRLARLQEKLDKEQEDANQQKLKTPSNGGK